MLHSQAPVNARSPVDYTKFTAGATTHRDLGVEAGSLPGPLRAFGERRKLSQRVHAQHDHPPDSFRGFSFIIFALSDCLAYVTT